MEKSQIIEEADLIRIQNIMKQYNRTYGYIAFVGDVLTFFDSEPSFGGCYITTDFIDNAINNTEDESI